MARIVGIGHQNFETIRMRNIFYVDKTKFIKDWWEKNDEVTLITRPRRFGKTLNMSMTEKFFSVEYANREDLFEGLTVWNDEKYRKLQGTYPVISLSFANIKDSDFITVRGKICQLLTNLYSQNNFLMESGILDDKEKNFFMKVSAEMDNVTATLAIYQLSIFLERYYGKKVIILLDEYDTPMQEAYVHGFWEELAAFTRSMFNAAFKTNPSMERAIMTGITRVGKESIFSDLNNLKIVTTTSNEYADSFGFTEKEVFDALDEFGLSGEKEKVKEWYDGFCFGNLTDIYNPWSITNFLDKKKYITYWANTSSNNLINILIREGSPQIKTDFEELMKGNSLKKQIDEQIVFNQLSQNEETVWSMMLASGYLKVQKYIIDEESGLEWYWLTLTNKEVKLMFTGMIRGWFAESGSHYNAFVRALLKNDIKSMNVYMNKVALATISYFDSGKKPSDEAPERFYHGFVLGLMVELADRYMITSNRESGYGRYDVMMEPLDRKDDAMIFEFKVHDPEEEKSLADTAKEALAQIDRENYAEALKAKGIEKEKIRKYGFAFEGKKVLINGGSF